MSADLSPALFVEFFEDVHGYPPHLWQQRLLAQILDDGAWPTVLDLPTGVGKTSVLDIALFAAAADPTQFGRRVVFVVDRRLIVDQVGEHAGRIESALNERRTPATGEVADRLRALSGGDLLLGVSALRGGRRDTEWAKRPDAAWVISSTVDQVGSRLLFAGYGVSDRMAPVHAGLLGNDVQLFLDEVHLSKAFAATLRTISKSFRPADARVVGPWQVVEMSATVGDHDTAGSVFGLESDDLDPDRSPLVHRIVSAPKPIELITVGKARQDAAEAIVDAVPDIVDELHDDTIAIVVNRVQTAVDVQRALVERGHEPMLLTGRMRGFERIRLLGSDEFRGLAAGRRTTGEQRIVVATQTIEVGADLDFGAMITEIAPIDSLRQRFGRVDRRGERAAAGRPGSIRILGPKSVVEASAPFDPVYGSAPVNTWRWLVELAESGSLDGGIGGNATAATPPPDALAPADTAPPLFRHHLDHLVQTSPRPHHTLVVAPYLHGTDDVDLDVQIVWRADLDEDHLRDAHGDPDVLSAVSDMVRAQPPHPEEELSVPLVAARRWLAHRPPTPVSDVPGRVDEESSRRSEESARPALRWGGTTPEVIVEPGALAPGDLLVVPAEYGGLRAGTWAPHDDTPVPDVADLVGVAGERSVRVIEEIFASPEGGPSFDVEVVDGDATLDPVDAIRSLTSVPREDVVDPPDLAQRVGTLLETSRVERYRTPAGWRFLLSGRESERPAAVHELDGSDVTNSLTGVRVGLTSHLHGVGQLAEQFARRVGLPDDVTGDLALAGRLHDLGKLDPRFQLLLHGGDVLEAAAADEPLAKSARPWTRTRILDDVAPEDRYPPGTRHELLSDAIVEATPGLLDEASDHELVRFLVTSHHGFCRPFAPAQIDPHPRRVKGEAAGVSVDISTPPHADITDARVADRFWTLVRRYGWYGLAWLEAIFRLADHRRSELEARREVT